MGVPSALSMGQVKFFSSIPIFGTDFLSFMDLIWGNLSLIIGSFLIAIFVGWRWGVKNAVNEIESSGKNFYLKNLWGLLIKFITPIAIFIILMNSIYTNIVK